MSRLPPSTTPSAVAYLVDPTVITEHRWTPPARWTAAAAAAYGVTLFDIRNGRMPRPRQPNCRVALRPPTGRSMWTSSASLLENTKK